MALTKRQLQNTYKEAEAKKEKEEKLQKLREGYMKDPSAAVQAKQTPVDISAGGIVKRTDEGAIATDAREMRQEPAPGATDTLRTELMEAADATRNAQSGNAAAAALQGIGVYNRANAGTLADEKNGSGKVGYIAEHGLAGLKTGLENIGTTIRSGVESLSDAMNRSVGQKEAGKIALPTIKTGTKPVARTYSDTQKYGMEDYSSPAKAVTTTAATDMLKNVEKYSKSDEQEARVEAIRDKYSDADIGAVTQLLADIAYSAGYSLPADAASILLGPAGSAVVMGTAAFSSALSEAQKKGYSRNDALQYAAKETLNQAAMETLFDVAGGGAAEGKIMDALDKIPNAVGRAAAKIGVTGVGEGLEETAQSIITAINQKSAGDDEASLDLSELGYEFLVGSLSGALRSAPVQVVQGVRGRDTDTPTAKDNTPTETTKTPTAETEQNVTELQQDGGNLQNEVAKTSEDVAKTSEDVAKTEYNGEAGTGTEEDPYLFDGEDETDVETSDDEYVETVDAEYDEESPVASALRIAETDVYAAGNELVDAYDGDVKAAVDALYVEGNRLAKDGTPEAAARLQAVEVLRNNIVSDRAKRVEQNAAELKKVFGQYGIKNVTVDMSLAEKTDRGYYNPATKTISLSPVLSGSEAVNFVAAHELVHAAAAADTTVVNDVMDIKDGLVSGGYISENRFAPERYMAAYAGVAAEHARSASGVAELKAYMDKGMSREEAIRQITDDYIRQEMAADLIGELTKNPDILKKIRREDRNLWQRIADWLRDAAAFLTGKTETREQQKLLDTIRSILEDVSGETVQRTTLKDGVAYNADGEAVSYQNKNGSVRLSIATYEDGGRDTLAQYMDKRVADGTLDAAARDDILTSMDEIYELCKTMTGEYKPFGAWSEAVVEVDENGDPVFSVVKPNGEYAMNLDFSLVCKKRRTLDAVFNEMIERGVISDFDLGQDKIVRINDVIREHGFETACTFCFVDAKRFRQAKVADDFVKMYNGLVQSMAGKNPVAYFNFGGDNTLPSVDGGIDTMSDDALDFAKLEKVLSGKKGTVSYKIAEHLINHPEDRKLLSRGDFMSSRGFEEVKKRNPAVLSLYNSKKGSGGPKAAFGDVQYLSDVLKSAKFKPEAAFDVGGVRVQSFSDYVSRLVFDYAQMIGDLAAKGLPAHAYTKEALFAKQFGLTGMKINMSLAPAVGDGQHAGLNADGSYAFSEESFDFDTAVAIQNDPEYGKNCGTIAIGVSDEHIWKLLGDDRIRMVIPYHKSGLNPVVAKMNRIDQFTDYTKSQNTRYKDGRKLSEADMKKHPNFNRMLQDGMDAVEASRAYVQWCEDNGYLPKFDKFAHNADGSFNENYYKMLEDFTTMVDGVYHKQEAVKAVFPREGAAFGSMESLIREGLSEDALEQGRRDSEVGGIVDEIVEMFGEEGDGIRYSREVDYDESDFTYRKLISKPDMPVVDLTVPASYNGESRPPRETVIRAAIDNAKSKNNPRNNMVNTFVENVDTGADILINADGIRHGLTRKYESNAIASAHIGELMENAILINRHTAREKNGEGGVYLAVGRNGDETYICRIITNDNDTMEDVEVLYALNAKKEPAAHYRQGSPEDLPVLLADSDSGTDAESRTVHDKDPHRAISGSTISIAELLDIVKDKYADILPNDVLSAMDKERANSNLSESMKYSKETRLEEENEYLKRQFVSRQGNEWAKAVKPSERRKYASQLAESLQGVSSSAIDAQLAKVWKVFEQPIRGRLDTMEVRYDESRKAAVEAAAELIAGAKTANLNPLYDQYADLRKRLRETAINPGSAKADIPDYAEWRKGSMGVLRLSDKGVSVEGIWDELAGLYPEFFDSTMTDEAERIMVLADVANKLRAVPGNPLYNIEGVSAEDAEAIISDMENTLANAMLSGYDLVAKETEAAKYEKERVRSENASAKAYAESMRGVEKAQENLEAERVRTENAAKQARAEAEGAILRYTDEAAGVLERANNAVIKARNFEKQVYAEFEREQKAMMQSIRKANRAVEAAQEKVIREKRKAEDARRRQELAAVRKRFMGNLTRLYNMAVDPTKNKHVPDEMREVVASLLEGFSGTRLPSGKTVDYSVLSGITETAYADAERESLGKFERIQGIIARNHHSDEGGVTENFIRDMKHQIDLLNTIYAEVYTKSPDDRTGRPDAAVTKNIEYLRQCDRVLSMADKYIRDMNVNFLAGKAVNAREMAESVTQTLAKRNPEKSDKFLADVQYDFMTPETFLDRLGPIGREITKAYRRAQNRQASREQSYTDYMKTLTGGKYSTYDVGFNGKLVEIAGNDGKIIKVPKDQIMELYVLWNRPAARRHIRKGGVIFLDELGKELDNRTMVFDGGIERVFETLTPEDRRICDGIVRFLSTRCAEWGNEASLYLYGYRKFGDPNYFPMSVSKSHLPGNWDTMDDFARLENMGFTKKLADNAAAPLRLGGIFNTADSHVRSMAAYASYAPVNNDLTRMIDMAGMKGNIEKYLGKRGYSYLTDFIKAVEQNKVRSGDNIAIAKGFDKLGNAYKRAAVSWNISTAMKQPVSIVRAFNAMDGKYIAQAYGEMTNHKAAVSAAQRMVESSGVAKMKVLGYSDVGFGKSLRQNYDDAYSPMGDRQKNMVLRNLAKAYEGFSDAGMWLAGKMDEATWARIWRACELEVADKYKGLNFTEQTKKVTERFNEVIGQTQVVDTILDNAPILRSEKASLYTAFMSEPVKSLNSLIAASDAVVEKRPGAKKKLAVAASTYAISNLLLEPIVSIAFSMFRDEEDESDFETVMDKALNLWIGLPAGKNGQEWIETEEGKQRVSELMQNGLSADKAKKKAVREYVWGGFGVNFISSQVFSNLTGAIPYVNGLIDAVTNTILGYDNDRIDMANISRAVQSTMNLVKSYQGSEKQKSQLNLWITAAEDALAVAGVPAKTFRRDITAVFRSVLQATDSYNLQWELNKVLYNLNSSTARTQKGFFDIMAKAAKAGDTEAYKRMSDDLEAILTTSSVGVKRSTILSQLEKRGYEPEVGSELWYIDLQAGFDLDTFNTAMTAEKMITDVYRKTGDDSILPQSPSNTFTVNGESVKIEDPIAYQEFAEEVGDYSYMILVNMAASEEYKSLTDAQKQSAITKAYDYARKRSRKNLYKDYDMNSNLFKELYGKNAAPAEVAKNIVRNVREKK